MAQHKSVNECLEEKFEEWLEIIDQKCFLSQEDKDLVREAYISGFDQGWKTCVARSYETYDGE